MNTRNKTFKRIHDKLIFLSSGSTTFDSVFFRDLFHFREQPFSFALNGHFSSLCPLCSLWFEFLFFSVESDD